uniref:SEL1-like repeat protein n=1 Tax=Aggregatibacter actinomycetemcomitans TaxID=714 RepID=UPI00292A3DC9|nr:DUF6396 domain-containing protein [Aggregatibacter actinomycetemcomitans]
MSAIVTGQVLWDINHNFCQSWDRKSNKQWGIDTVETDLTVQRNNFSREHYSYENNFFRFLPLVREFIAHWESLKNCGRAEGPIHWFSTAMPQTEVHNLNEALAKQLPATAYYKLYGYLDVGYGVRTEADGKYAYLRKAADLGSREAQYVVAEMLADIEDNEETEEAFKYRLNLVEQLWACASEQGLGEASINLGISLKSDKKYSEAVKIYHQGVKNGDDSSARRLANAFSGKPKEGEMYFLNLPEDQERSIRYKIIENYLYDHDYLQPKVPDLDEIVPLPPAPLPDWDGKIAFQHWFEGEAPPKPSETLMFKLANQAGVRVDNGLDLQTDLPKAVKK